MSGVLNLLGDILFPPGLTCDVCGRETFDGKNICPKCAKELHENDGAVCPICGRKTQTHAVCLECKKDPPSYDRAVSALVYEGSAVALVLAFKKNKPYLKDYFASLLAPKCMEFAAADGVCFIPMTKKDERRRGYNQAELLARELAKRLSIPLVPALEKVRRTGEQKTLSKKERRDNLKGCFKAAAEVKGKSLILVDDVLTTGATAEEAAKTLKKKGAEHVYFATVASVENKVQP